MRKGVGLKDDIAGGIMSWRKIFERNGDEILIDLGNEKITLTSEDILEVYTAKEGLKVVGDRGSVVSLDLNLTKELKEEGFAREIVRNIQDARKSLNLFLLDKINLEIVGDYPTSWKEYIANETLANFTQVQIPEFSGEISDDESKITFKISKA